MTANADTGATRADTTATKITDAPGRDATSHSAGSHSSSRAGIDGEHRSWTPATHSDVRHDRIRWGAVWTGVLTTLSIYIVLQLLFFALGWLDLGINGADGTTRAIVSGVLALIAFFLGGAAAGASALWHRATARWPTPQPSSSTCAPPAPASTSPRPPAPPSRPQA